MTPRRVAGSQQQPLPPLAIRLAPSPRFFEKLQKRSRWRIIQSSIPRAMPAGCVFAARVCCQRCQPVRRRVCQLARVTCGPPVPAGARGAPGRQSCRRRVPRLCPACYAGHGTAGCLCAVLHFSITPVGYHAAKSKKKKVSYGVLKKISC